MVVVERRIWSAADVRRAGGLDALKMLGQPGDVLKDTKARMFAA
jgi:hypothetical protein